MSVLANVIYACLEPRSTATLRNARYMPYCPLDPRGTGHPLDTEIYPHVVVSKRSFGCHLANRSVVLITIPFLNISANAARSRCGDSHSGKVKRYELTIESY